MVKKYYLRASKSLSDAVKKYFFVCQKVLFVVSVCAGFFARQVYCGKAAFIAFFEWFVHNRAHGNTKYF